MERDFKRLDEIFDGIIEGIKDPKSFAEHQHTLDLSVDRNGLGFSEAVSVIKVNISADKMTAYASIVAGGANPRHRSFDEIMAVISSKGIVHGLDEEAVRSISDGKLFDKSVVIARGTEPINGTDGYMEPLYDCDNGKEIKNIDVGTVICRIVEPTAGTLGCNVLGEAIPAQDGCAVPDMAGENIELDGSELVTRASGTLALRGGLYSIINEMIIDNDVTAAMGVVSFAGTIIVRGNVRDKSVIRAGSSVIIMGFAFGAVIEAGNDITISKSTENAVVLAKRGFVKGRDFTDCAISAGTFIEAASISASKVKAITGINCLIPSGSISGGDVECVGCISCLVLGTRRRDLTIVNLGDNGEYTEMLKRQKKQLRYIQVELDKVNKRIEKLRKDQKSGDISLDDENFLVAAVKITDQLRAEEEEARKRVEETTEILALSETAELTVKTMLYSNVAIGIRGKYHTTESDSADVVVSENGHGIVVV